MVRRSVDIAVSGASLVLLSPVLASVALAVRLTMGAPVLFRQTRSGRRGEEFTIVKFRTMRVASGEVDASDLSRTTKLGEVLRLTSLDELPELWNVLRGDMSLVGPRPTLPEQVARYTDFQRRRLEVKPGLTGWAQVNGRNALSWSERIELDVWYVDHRSLALDLKIVARTVVQLLRPQEVSGGEGFNPAFPADDSPPPPTPLG